MMLKQSWRERPLWALVVLVLMLGGLYMPAEIYPGDPVTMREETRAILLHGELAVEEIVAINYRQVGEAGQYVVDNPRNGRSYSKYGSMAAWMYLLPMGAELLIEGKLPPFGSPIQVVYLNVFNIVISGLVAASIYRTARRFDAGPWKAALFVAICFYTTFLWNYLRAQNSEIIQLLFFAWAVTGFLDTVDERRNGGVRRWALHRMWAACAALFLTKVSYVFIGPLFAMGLLIDRIGREGSSWWTAFCAEARHHVVPCGLMIGFWAMLNWVKFGHPLLTGYHRWKPEQHGLHGSLLDSLPPLLSSAQWGFVVCFPVLAIALPWMARWLRTKPAEYGTIFGIAIVYLILIGMLPSWHGAWCYGPRYWIFILPFVALPAIGTFDWLQTRTRAALLTGCLIALVLWCSAWLQMQVNRFPFFAYYQLTGPLAEVSTPAKDAFFGTNTYGWIEYSMWRCRHRLERLRWWAEIKATSPAEAVAWYEQEVRNILGRSNLFLFPNREE